MRFQGIGDSWQRRKALLWATPNDQQEGADGEGQHNEGREMTVISLSVQVAFFGQL